MLNALWSAMFAVAVVCGALRGRLGEVAQGCVDGASQSVTLALGLVGPMILWLGLVRVLREAGLMKALAGALRPAFVRLFPEVPAAHPALAMMVLNMASNVLGLGNAATPFGLAAMRELNHLNPRPGTATDSMVVFLAINTSGLAVLPTGMMALRASLGSHAPGAIFLPTLLATLCAAVAGVVAARLLARLPRYRLAPVAALDELPARGGAPALDGPSEEALSPSKSAGAPLVGHGTVQPWVGAATAACLFAAFGYATWQLTQQAEGALGWHAAVRRAVGEWSLLLLMSAFVCVGLWRNVRVYDAVVEGGREGFEVAVRILPYLTTILVGVGMLRASGAVDVAVNALAPYTALVGMPAEALPMALLRPLTGTGAYAIAADTMRTYGPDSLAGQVASTIMGSTETTFYVLGLYLGTVGVRRARHALWTCLIADIAGTLVAVWSCRLLLH